MRLTDLDQNRLYQLAHENQKEAALDMIFQGVEEIQCLEIKVHASLLPPAT